MILPSVSFSPAFRPALLILVVVLGLWGCSSAGHQHPPSQGVVLWYHDKALIAGPLKQQIEQDYQQLLDVAAQQIPLALASDPLPNAYAERVEEKGADSAIQVRLNAGLIDLLGYDREAMAFVLAHEIGHVALGHLSEQARNERMEQDITADWISTVADIVLPMSSLLVLAGNEALQAGYSRDQERDADRYGLELMVQAGFDPQGAIRFQQQLLGLTKRSSLALMASHPQGQERIANLQQLIDQQAETASIEKAELH